MTLLPSHLLAGPASEMGLGNASCDHDPVLLILLFDNSPSVAGRNDALGQRFAQAAAALAEWQQRSSCDRHLVALCSFDTKGRPVRLRSSEWRPVLSSLAHSQDHSSRLRPALVHAERLARAHQDHRAVLVVLSDFELLDDVPWLVLRRLRRFPGRVHAVVLGNEPPRQLVGGPVAVSRCTASALTDLARTVLAAVEPER